MIGCIEYNMMLDVGSFYADTKAEQKKLPTLNRHGMAELSNMNEVHVGSNCICYEDGEVYFLTGRNKWEKYLPEGGGSGGGGDDDDDDPYEYEDEDIDFHEW